MVRDALHPRSYHSRCIRGASGHGYHAHGSCCHPGPLSVRNGGGARWPRVDSRSDRAHRLHVRRVDLHELHNDELALAHRSFCSRTHGSPLARRVGGRRARARPCTPQRSLPRPRLVARPRAPHRILLAHQEGAQGLPQVQLLRHFDQHSLAQHAPGLPRAPACAPRPLPLRPVGYVRAVLALPPLLPRSHGPQRTPPLHHPLPEDQLLDRLLFGPPRTDGRPLQGIRRLLRAVHLGEQLP
mmetsp:Transcript_22311/g.60252  ORF Transcript_22311/g.60252 Transcript_22311/m.60252 type:complete len:241 (-) Transcript_22311:164-886(-)